MDKLVSGVPSGVSGSSSKADPAASRLSFYELEGLSSSDLMERRFTLERTRESFVKVSEMSPELQRNFLAREGDVTGELAAATAVLASRGVVFENLRNLSSPMLTERLRQREEDLRSLPRLRESASAEKTNVFILRNALNREIGDIREIFAERGPVFDISGKGNNEDLYEQRAALVAELASMPPLRDVPRGEAHVSLERRRELTRGITEIDGLFEERSQSVEREMPGFQGADADFSFRDLPTPVDEREAEVDIMRMGADHNVDSARRVIMTDMSMPLAPTQKRSVIILFARPDTVDSIKAPAFYVGRSAEISRSMPKATWEPAIAAPFVGELYSAAREAEFRQHLLERVMLRDPETIKALNGIAMTGLNAGSVTLVGDGPSGSEYSREAAMKIAGVLRDMGHDVSLPQIERQRERREPEQEMEMGGR